MHQQQQQQQHRTTRMCRQNDKTEHKRTPRTSRNIVTSEEIPLHEVKNRFEFRIRTTTMMLDNRQAERTPCRTYSCTHFMYLHI